MKFPIPPFPKIEPLRHFHFLQVLPLPSEHSSLLIRIVEGGQIFLYFLDSRAQERFRCVDRVCLC